MIVAGKIGSEILKEDNIRKYGRVLVDVANCLIKEYKKRHTTSQIVEIYRNGYSIDIKRIYNKFNKKFYEKSSENLFMSFWKSKEEEEKNIYYQLVGAETLYNKFGKEFGDYYLLVKMRIVFSDDYEDGIYIHFIKLYKYLTLDEIKSRYRLVEDLEYEKFKKNKLENIALEEDRIDMQLV